MIAAEAAADATETPALPQTAAEAEALARELDAERAAIAERFREHNRHMPRGADPEWTAVVQQLTRAGLELDKKRGAAWKFARTLKADEARRRQWEAAHAVHGEFREICSQIARALDDALPALEAAQEMRRMLEETTGRCQLHDLRCDLDEIRRLRWSASLVVTPPSREPKWQRLTHE